MQKANQEQVIQTTNVDLANIRSAEISYFSTFFSNFATQAALIATCIIQSVSQLPGLDDLYIDDDYYLYYAPNGTLLINPDLSNPNITCKYDFKSSTLLSILLKLKNKMKI